MRRAGAPQNFPCGKVMVGSSPFLASGLPLLVSRKIVRHLMTSNQKKLRQCMSFIPLAIE